MQLTSSVFQQGAEITSYYTSDGEDVSPELSWKDAPAETKSFALIIHDPDAPRPGGFTHWVLYNVPGDRGELDPNVPKGEQVPGTGTQGKNDSGEIGYTGPCPPSGTHRYYARLFALDAELRLKPGASQRELSEAMEGHVLERAELMGTYKRKAEQAA